MLDPIFFEIKKAFSGLTLLGKGVQVTRGVNEEEIVSERELLNKKYEFSNHLGNVLTVTSDLKLGLDNYGSDGIVDAYNADVLSYSDYYPGGSLLPGRNANPGSYRHGYQGSETDNEITGTSGTHITTFFRENDTRLLRWWSMDPVKYAWLSPYQSMNLNPILFNDPLGDKIRAGKQEKKDLRQQARSDKSFRKTYKKWKKADEIYEVNRQDQANGNATTTLNKAVPQSFNDEGKEGNKNYNYVYYSAVEGSKQGGYSVLELTYREVNEFSIMVSPMKWDDNSWSLSSQIQQNNFSHWQVFSPKMDNVDTKIKVQNANEQRTVLTSSVFNGNPSESIYNDGHDLQWGSIFYNFKVTAMSKPIIVRVDRNWLGRLKWSAGVYDYNPSFGESPESVSRDIGNPIRRKNYQGPWVVMSGKH